MEVKKKLLIIFVILTMMFVGCINTKDTSQKQDQKQNDMSQEQKDIQQQEDSFQEQEQKQEQENIKQKQEQISH